MSDVDVSVVIVNYASGEFLLPCIESLQAEARGYELEIVVVDCASPIDQSRVLSAVRDRGVPVIELRENRGYGGGCNAGIEATTGRHVIMSNPDLIVLEGCLAALIDTLETDNGIGFVTPRSYIDDNCCFQVPEFDLLSRASMIAEYVHCASRWLAKRSSLRRARKRMDFWEARAVTEHDCLPGAFLAARRSTLEELGGFDDAFPLYYEDTDLCRRARDAGYRLVTVPDAVVVHYAHRSSAKVWIEAMVKLRRGRRHYLRKHIGPLSVIMDAVLFPLTSWLVQLRARRELRAFEDLGERVAPPAIEWGGSDVDFLIELAFSPNFLEATGSRGRGSSYVFSAESWRSLAPIRYYVRVLELPGMRECGRWRVDKTEEAV